VLNSEGRAMGRKRRKQKEENGGAGLKVLKEGSLTEKWKKGSIREGERGLGGRTSSRRKGLTSKGGPG